MKNGLSGACCPLTSFAMWPKSVKEHVTKMDSVQTKPPARFNPANQVFFVVPAKWQPYRLLVQPRLSLHGESFSAAMTTLWVRGLPETCSTQVTYCGQSNLTRKPLQKMFDRSLSQHDVGSLPG